MKQTPRVHIMLRRSKRLGFFIPAAAVLTAALLWTLPCPWWVVLTANVLILAWAYWVWQKLVARKRSCRPLVAFTLSADGTLLLENLHGDESGSHVMKRAMLQDGYYVGNHFVTLIWREEGSGAKGTAILLPDMMDNDEWRKLRVLLRYAHAENAVAPDVL